VTAPLWRVRLGDAADDLVVEIRAPTAQDAAELAAARFDRELRLVRKRASLAATVTLPETGDSAAFTVRAQAVPVYTAHLERSPCA